MMEVIEANVQEAIAAPGWEPGFKLWSELKEGQEQLTPDLK